MWPEGAVLLGVGGPFQEVLAFHQSSAWSPWPGPSPSVLLPLGPLGVLRKPRFIWVHTIVWHPQ